MGALSYLSTWREQQMHGYYERDFHHASKPCERQVILRRGDGTVVSDLVLTDCVLWQGGSCVHSPVCTYRRRVGTPTHPGCQVFTGGLDGHPPYSIQLVSTKAEIAA
jgi:hypothetical protein